MAKKRTRLTGMCQITQERYWTQCNNIPLVEMIREIDRNDNTEWSSEENIDRNSNYSELHGLFLVLKNFLLFILPLQ